MSRDSYVEIAPLSPVGCREGCPAAAAGGFDRAAGGGDGGPSAAGFRVAGPAGATEEDVAQRPRAAVAGPEGRRRWQDRGRVEAEEEAAVAAGGVAASGGGAGRHGGLPRHALPGLRRRRAGCAAAPAAALRSHRHSKDRAGPRSCRRSPGWNCMAAAAPVAGGGSPPKPRPAWLPARPSARTSTPFWPISTTAIMSASSG